MAAAGEVLRSRSTYRSRRMRTRSGVIVLAVLVAFGLSTHSALGTSAAAGTKRVNYKQLFMGRWIGTYIWNNEQTHEIVLTIDVFGGSNGRYAFSGIADWDGCQGVTVRGTVDSTNKVLLDETVAPACPNFILDGLYRGRVNTAKRSMSLEWSAPTFRETGALFLKRA